ncbi:MAG TPA: hypothetical protein VE974_13970 [Thermoanaerobaculia bacterium]|nr:hypothetical protein [Thermoanaerobaculia bacterium]
MKLTIVILCAALASPAGAAESNPFLDGSAAGQLQVQVLERVRQASTPPVMPRAATEPSLERITSPDPPGTRPDPVLPATCRGACITRAKWARVGMRVLVEIARGISR